MNLDRQPLRWERLRRELRRFATADGVPLVSIAARFSAVDARDRRTVAATADVDSTYRLADQLYVQPDVRLSACFQPDEQIRMTPQEIAIARSHIEVWKSISSGSHDHVLVLEDDVWFRPRAAKAIDRGWRAALARGTCAGGPDLLYLSYSDAEGTVEREDVCDAPFRPKRGLWFLSGYVLSRQGANKLLEALPVVGPVDLWINYRFAELGALALVRPAILQKRDCASDNSYSIMPYLARAGIVDVGSLERPSERGRAGPLLAWTRRGERESLPMALSMLGLRVRVFDGNEPALDAQAAASLFGTFDALVDARLGPDVMSALLARGDMHLVQEAGAELPPELDPHRIPRSRITVVASEDPRAWEALCRPLRLHEPEQAFPTGAPRSFRLFRGSGPRSSLAPHRRQAVTHDESPWVLPARANWSPRDSGDPASPTGETQLRAATNAPTDALAAVAETFPGNLASFAQDGIRYVADGRI